MIDDFTLFKEEVKNRVDIVDIIGEFVELKRRGTAHIGLCPFHTEKTPSFNVNAEGQFYHCFGCGKGGDVISFLMDITGMSFMEALEQLAERTGLTMPERTGMETTRKNESDRIMAANLAAAEYFHKTLYEDEGKAGMDYLTGRGLAPETIWAFRLGYSPTDPRGLLAFARGKGVNPDDLNKAGIVLSSSYGVGPYARFGGRVIFPIIDQTARILGFGGRILEGDGAKYVNSPETAVYHKSRVLYGIYQAKSSLKRERTAIVVEGYMDVISLHQAGITNVIAASGTSFTVDQAKILSRMARKVILLFDSDEAGLSAAARGADNLLVTDLDIGVVVLPEGHDPDSLVRERGAEGFREVLESIDLWEFKLQSMKKGSSDINSITKTAGEVADSIALIGDELKRDIYIRDMSLKLGIDIEAMRKAVNGRIKKRSRHRETQTPAVEKIGTSGERDLLACLLQFPGLARHFMEEAGSKPFPHDAIKNIVDELFHRIVEGLDTTPSALMSGLDDKKAQELVASLAVVSITEDRASKIIEDNLKRFKIHEINGELARLRQKIAAEKDTKKKTNLIERQNNLNEQLKTVRGQ
ncbi:MAG: DNA primase [Candidatus Latescibacteria bacterium]|nr:DNA primase [Candidatus Latescibacterota bacterium]